MHETRWCKVLVVEDEPPILNNLARKVDGLALPVQVCATACDGEQACRCVEQTVPDIVITDIRMPGMDGLALSRWLHEHHPAVKIIILSGYSEFEYARAAIQYQVADYLLKPVNAQKLFEALEKLCHEIGERNRAVQRQYLAKQLSGELFSNDLPCKFEAESFGLLLICLGNLLGEYEPSDAERCQSLWAAAQLESALNALPFLCWWVVEEKSPGERMVLTVGHIPEAADTIYRHLQATLHGQAGVNICGAPGPVPFSEIWAVAKEMRCALHSRLVPCQSACFTPQTSVAPSAVESAHTLLTSGAQSRQSGAFRTAVRAALTALQAGGATQHQLEETMFATLHAIAQQAPAQSKECRRLHQSCCRQIALAQTVQDVYASLEATLTEAFHPLSCSAPLTEDLAETVGAYIAQNYRSEITMEQLARQFHFSESYITRLFRSKFGVPPVKYLLSLRMEKAKELLLQTPAMSLATVAELVGYADPHYFSRLFRISSGVSPSAYRQR